MADGHENMDMVPVIFSAVWTRRIPACSKKRTPSRHKLIMYAFIVAGNLKTGHIYSTCEDGRFAVSSCCVAISNPESLSSSETGINPGIRS
jgi:hypothetical protein